MPAASVSLEQASNATVKILLAALLAALTASCAPIVISTSVSRNQVKRSAIQQASVQEKIVIGNAEQTGWSMPDTDKAALAAVILEATETKPADCTDAAEPGKV